MSADFPLRGVRVIELCWVWSGPLLGQLLADLGAEVIKVEWYKRFDLYRTRGVERLTGKVPEEVRREMSQSFHGLNRNKLGVTLDLKDPEHRAALIELAAESHLVIENFTAGTLDRLGIGYDVLAASQPGIVLLSLAGFGSTSRLADMRAYGLALSSLSGLESVLTDPTDGSFLGSPTFVASDPNAATYGLPVAIAAVLGARETGRGGHVELSQLEAAGHVGGDDDGRLSELAISLGLDPILPTAHGAIFPVADDRHICVDLAGVSDANAIASATKDLSLADALGYCFANRLPAVRIIEQASETGAGAADAGTLLSTIHPVSGVENIVAAPWWIDGHRPPLRKTAPTLGESNAYVLGSLLGWPREKYAGFGLVQEASR